MYGKIFESIYDGSLYGHFEAIVTFQALIVLADEHGLIDISPHALAGRTSYLIEIIKAGLKVLQQSDPHSRSQDEDGKRIVPLDNGREFGWRIVNYDYYRNLARRADKTVSAAERQRRKRKRDSQNVDSKDVSQDVTNGHASSRMSRHEDANANANANANADEKTTAAPKEPPEFAEFKKAYPLRSGAQPWTRALKTIRARLKEGDQWDAILAGARRYAVYCDSVDRTGTEYVMQAVTFCGSDKHYLETWNPPATKSELRQDKNIDAGKGFLEASSGQ